MKSANQGFTLSEIMIAGLISMLLMLGLFKLWLQVKTHYAWLHNKQILLTHRLDVARLLQKSINQSGYLGCRHGQDLVLINSKNTKPSAFLINHFDKHSNVLPAPVKRRMLAQNDALVLMQVNPPSLVGSPDKVTQGQTLIETRAQKRLNKKEEIIISDCLHAEKNQLTALYKKSIILKYPILFNYHQPIIIGALTHKIFFIGKNSQGNSALYMSDGNRSVEISNWVKKMHIEKIKASYPLFYLQLTFEKNQTNLKPL
jgi:type II secretory pathway component PulJ